MFPSLSLSNEWKNFPVPGGWMPWSGVYRVAAACHTENEGENLVNSIHCEDN